jgi:hypothetical protein
LFKVLDMRGRQMVDELIFQPAKAIGTAWIDASERFGAVRNSTIARGRRFSNKCDSGNTGEVVGHPTISTSQFQLQAII